MNDTCIALLRSLYRSCAFLPNPSFRELEPVEANRVRSQHVLTGGFGVGLV
jgi:hypothetical protein